MKKTTFPISLSKPAWNPYIAGIAIGILSWLVFLVVDKPLGMSTEVSKLSGSLLKAFGGNELVENNDYWTKKIPQFGYSTVFLISTAVGAFFSSIFGKSFHAETVPDVWKKRFGSNPAKRFLAAFLGGFLILYGARTAGGCTSGHAISGTLQLAVSGWAFFIFMMAGGLVTAKVLFPSRKT